ncbi:Cyclin-dependent kinase 1 [Astathelohania contejeani]|uniref:non-specific serine/threonine protein kinase n=1 Tax=Astathelohania contejeani TaxID=164912 RepID=A0ABQ7I0E6_9MICR|nr:Cyclin-dependent kinase 1 [Thelohania contejeani]
MTRLLSPNILLRYKYSIRNLKSDHRAIIPGYLLDKVIGRGTYGVVYKGKRIYDGKEVAIKESMLNCYSNELTALYSINHPNIVSLTTHFIKNDIIFLVFDSCCIPINDVSELPLVKVVEGVLKAAVYLDSINICHGDWHSKNIVVGCDGEIKVTDFGCSYFNKDFVVRYHTTDEVDDSSVWGLKEAIYEKKGPEDDLRNLLYFIKQLIENSVEFPIGNKFYQLIIETGDIRVLLNSLHYLKGIIYKPIEIKNE